MKKLLVLFLLGSSLAYGQRNFNLNETVFGPRQYAPKTIIAQQWLPHTDAFTHLDESYQKLMIRDAKSNWSAKEISNVTAITEALRTIIKEDFKLNSFPSDYKWKNDNELEFNIPTASSNYRLSYTLKDKSIRIVTQTPTAASNVEYSSDYSKTAYLIANNIIIQDKSGVKTEVTKDSNPAIINGSDNTHRQEFGIKKGMWWSPSNDKLLYYRKDETMVSTYPLIQWGERVAAVKDIRYPMAGMKSEEVTLVIHNLNNSQKITLQTGEPKEQFLTMCTWDPSGKFVYVGLLNREQNHLKLNKYNAETGALVKTLFEEQSSSWVEPQHELTFLPNNPNQFLYQTDINGFNQLYLYTNEGKLLQKLAHSDVIVDKLLSFNSKGDRLSYIGITNKGLDRQLFEVHIPTAKTTQLTTEPGFHNALLSSSGKYVLDQFSNSSTPNKVDVIALNNKAKQTILAAENPFIGKIDLPKIEAVSLTSPDGTTALNGRIIYPNNFDPNKKYPVMVYLYGGSHAQLVQNRWLYGSGYFDLYMAQQGYIVFTMDNRGSDARGRDFTRVTHRQLGQAEMADQLQGIAYLKQQPFVDAERMGIFGWSFGGFMTTSFMTHHPDIFKAAVAGGPVMDWKYYEIMYGERYMDTPQENPEGYAATSLVNKADKLKGNLLIIHGAQDPVVVQQHSMDFVEACIKAGKQVDYFLYPTHEHNVSGKDRVHMYEKIAKYFDLHLKK